MAEGSEARKEITMKRVVLMINCILLATGATGGPLVIRLYFIHGGSRVWMIINNDLKVISTEAKHFGLGEATYYVISVVSAMIDGDLQGGY
ncbi:unnamed protein product [Lupinus luteus]|uniref:Uncharacterized protein n=1 Tax=Lupinus luteus TaxID=3873 RepID=A0AAV1VRZ3_LUPLU